MTQPVLIIGAGPVGLTLASELARYGVTVRIVDKAMHRTDKSKAMVLWSRTLELLDRGGSDGAAPFVEAGFKIAGVTFMAGDQMVGRVAMDHIPSVHAYALALPQSETERLLEERLSQQGVIVERGTEAVAYKLLSDGAEVVLRHADGREETVQAPWLVGCDGAHSGVRHALGLPFSGETLMSDWFLADVHMTGYPDSPLNGVHVRGGLRSGERIPPVQGQRPIGSGETPKFVLFADTTESVMALAREFGTPVDANIRPALHKGAIALARPDGYLACSAADRATIAAYLRELSQGFPQAAKAGPSGTPESRSRSIPIHL